MQRFKDHIKRYGFKIRRVAFRPDILSVQYMNLHLMTIPKKLYAFPSEKHTSMDGLVHPDYFDREQKAVAWNMKVKRSNFLEEAWQNERIHNQKLGVDWITNTGHK